MAKIDKRRDRLTARLAELDGRLHRIEGALDAPVSPDWEDAAVEREGDEVLETLGRSGEAELRMIRAALERMERDTYGICQSCGAPVAAARLDLLPETPLCGPCAARKDRS